jgi:hypothetical protein
MKRLSSAWTPFFKLMYLAAGLFFLAFGVMEIKTANLAGEVLPFLFGLCILCIWVPIIRHAANVSMDDSSLLMEQSGSQIRIPFKSVMSVYRPPFTIYTVKVRYKNDLGKVSQLVIILSRKEYDALFRGAADKFCLPEPWREGRIYAPSARFLVDDPRIREFMERGYWLNPGEIPTEEDVKRLVSGEHKINAIKLYRELNPGVSLQEAKDRVEQMAAASV